jgi:hypothetical protein
MRTQRYTVLYLSNDRLSGFGTYAVNATDAVRQFRQTHPTTDVEFVDLGEMEQVVLAYMLEQQKVGAPVTVWKVTYNNGVSVVVSYIGADNEQDAYRVADERLREDNLLGLILYGSRSIKQAPFWGREYGVLDWTEVES